MARRLIACLLLALASVAHGQVLLSKFGPVTGVLKGTAGQPATANAGISDLQSILSTSPGLVLGGATGGAQGTGSINATALYINGAPVGTAGGAVSSVGLSMPSMPCTVSGSPVTAAGTLTCSANTQTANTVWAGPTSGGAAVPGFRALVAADIPALGASPSATFGVNLTGANGSATTYLRSDAVLKLDQSISPTMTGQWTFTPPTAPPNLGRVIFNGNAAGNGTVAIFGSATSGLSTGLVVEAGTTIADYGLLVLNSAGTRNEITTQGDGSFSLGSQSASGAITLSGTANGNVTIPAPASGIGLQVTGVSGGASPSILSLGRISISGDAANNNAEIDIANTGSSGSSWRLGDGIGVSNGNFALYDTTHSRVVLSGSGTGNVNIPVSLSVGGTALKYAGVNGICSGSGCTLTSAQNVSGISRSSAGVYTVSFTAGFTSAPNCAASTTDAAPAANASLAANSSTSVVVETFSIAGTATDHTWSLACVGI